MHVSEQLFLYLINCSVCFVAIFVWVMFLLILFYNNCHSPCLSLRSLRQVLLHRTRKRCWILFTTDTSFLIVEWKKMNFITSFSDGQENFRHRLEVEPCWPNRLNCIQNSQQKAERAIQKRQQKQRYVDSNLRGLKPNYLQLKAQEQLLEYRNATWNDFSSHNIQEDVMIQVSSMWSKSKLNWLHWVMKWETSK